MKWEYLFRHAKYESFDVFKDVDKHINELGQEGWELVSVTPDIQRQFFGSLITKGFVFYFKRPKQ